MTCPTCDSNCNEFCGSMVQQRCSDCGSWWSPNTGEVLFVPERSKPVEVLDLPDLDGGWWHLEYYGKWKVRDIEFHAGKPFFSDVQVRPRLWCLPGRYVRCIPPIVPPPVRDADEVYWKSLNAAVDDLAATVAALSSRIADHLEHETKGAERE